MKYQHGERIDIRWDDGREYPEHYIRGHVTEAEARAALNEWEPGCGEGQMALQHIYGRLVFCDSYEYDRALNVYTEQKRGAFKLTKVLTANMS